MAGAALARPHGSDGARWHADGLLTPSRSGPLASSPYSPTPRRTHHTGTHIPLLVAPRTLLLPLAALALVAACAPGPPPSLATGTMLSDTVWYISARAREHGRATRRLADTLEHGYVVFARPVVRDRLTSRLRLTLVDSVRVSQSDFVLQLGARIRTLSAPHDFAVLYLHGFGTSLHEAWTFANTARARSGAEAPWIAFSWPSNGSGVARPRRGEIFSRSYRDDSAAAAASHHAFAQATLTVIEAVGAPRLVVVAHSLGGQVMGETLAEDASLRRLLGVSRLRAVAFVAPDVEARRFADYVVPSLTPLSSRVVLYTSSRDRVLALSRAISNSERAGLHRGVPLTHDGMETVDVTAGLRAGGWLQRAFGTRHGIAGASGSLFDIAWVVGPGRSPACRVALRTATEGAAGVWHLTATLPDPPIDLARCPEVPAVR